MQSKSVGYFWCGNGHVYAFGDEEWHFALNQGLDEQTNAPIPTACTHDVDGEPCFDSSTIVGPFLTAEEAQADRQKSIDSRPTEIADSFAVFAMEGPDPYRVSYQSSAEEALARAAKFNSPHEGEAGPKRFVAVRISHEVLS